MILIRKFTFILLFFFLISPSYLYADSISYLNISTGFLSEQDVKFVNISVLYEPIEAEVYNLSRACSCQCKIGNKSYVFEHGNNCDIDIIYKLLVKDDIIPVKYINYSSYQRKKPLIKSENVDYNNTEIIKEANKIRRNFTDDYYHNVFIVSQWVNKNIKYNLTTLTEKTSQNASWVLKNRYGVCDEITNLFIALLAALDIPARYISGVVYVNNAYSPHGWSEVYFPGYGWVPYDITFEEYGFVDDRHIGLKVNASHSTIFKWLESNITPKDLKIKGTQKKINETHYYNISLSHDRKHIIANLENPNDFYVPVKLSISKPKEIKCPGKLTTYLKPHEKKTIKIPFKAGNLSYGYLYKFPVIINEAEENIIINKSIGLSNIYYANKGEILNFSINNMKRVIIEYNDKKKEFRDNSFQINTDELKIGDNMVYYSIMDGNRTRFRDVIIIHVRSYDYTIYIAGGILAIIIFMILMNILKNP